MWGIIPAAGLGTRIQPLAFSKELLPVGSTTAADGVERPRAVSEYLVERMLRAGATKLCFVISSAKADLMRYYGSAVTGPDGQRADVVYVVQDKPGGLCDAVFRACPFVNPGDHVLVGLPDTIWYPADGLAHLGEGGLSFLLFPVENPTVFDAVVCTGNESDPSGDVREIQVKHPDAQTNWVWGAFKMPGRVLHELQRLWLARGRRDEYVGTLVNAYLANGGQAVGVRRGTAYVDVGTLHGYRSAIALLMTRTDADRNALTPAQPSPAEPTPIKEPRPMEPPPPKPSKYTREQIQQRVRELGQWFHNLDLHGVRTAPDHFLHDFPNVKWAGFKDALPADLTGKTVLDIGCNGGFYSLEMKRRGADRVVGIDFDDYYLDQARFAADALGVDVDFRRLSVYDVAALGERFDVVIFMGLLYHLRHPLLALDLIHEHVAGDLLVYQSMQRGSREVEPVADDYDFFDTDVFDRPGYPKLHFIEKRYSHDETNWWAPNAAASEAMLRSAGFAILSHPEEETYVCRRVEVPAAPAGRRAVYPAGTRAVYPAQRPDAQPQEVVRG